MIKLIVTINVKLSRENEREVNENLDIFVFNEPEIVLLKPDYGFEIKNSVTV